LPSAPSTTGSCGAAADLTQWTFWWGFNKEPYLNLKAHVHRDAARTGDGGFFLGSGQRRGGERSLRPDELTIRQEIVPALLAALEKETQNDIVSGCLIALAKIGDEPSETGESALEEAFVRWLPDNNQEISETAAISLGILANPASIDTLSELLLDSARGRRLVGRSEVPHRTRAFAAYGLGLIGARGAEPARRRIVAFLADTLRSDESRVRDLRVSCVIALGLVPLETIEDDGPGDLSEEEPPLPATRLQQIDFLTRYFLDENQNFLVRAHCPSAITRLVEGLPERHHETVRRKVTDLFVQCIQRDSKVEAPIRQSCVLALGQLGSSDGDNPTDKRIREELSRVAKNLRDQQSRYFALIAMGQVGGRAAGDDVDGAPEASSYLLQQLSRGKQQSRPWAGLACGVMGASMMSHSDAHPLLSTLRGSVRTALVEGKDRAKVPAYAIALGMMRDEEASVPLRKILERTRDDETRGFVAVALGLLGDDGAQDALVEVVERARYRPDLLRQSSIALGLLGHKEICGQLVEMLGEAKSLATQAAIASALGFIGDRDSVEPLIGLLNDEDRSFAARGLAAAALGIVADKEMLPWNSKISVDLNYRAATGTLTSPARGTGVLDIL